MPTNSICPNKGSRALPAAKLVIDRVRKSYGPVHALRETSLDVESGEFLTLLGPSGSGKTTLLTILAGLVVPDAGEISFGGVNQTYAPVHKRDIGLVFQNYALFPHLSVFENIAFPLRMRRVPEREISTRVARMLEIVRLPHVAERLPRELSGGQQQRIALARCAVYQPSVILMDEPLGALDKKLRDQMQVEIKRLHSELGTTILYVTHDQEEAMAMSDRICLMHDGGIEQLGTPAELYFEPRTVFAADFLGGANVFALKRGGDGTPCCPDGAPLHYRATEAASTAAGHFMVRPEHLRPLKAQETSDNSVSAVLEHVVMSGAVTRYHAALADGQTIVATRLTDGPPTARVGDCIRLGWSAERTVLLGGAA
ncbi:ABC transporter ATP-binding protein [Bosea sp. (in: a-proteobacteria)]|jgi:putative spermidine/putrescine transport system ATP-binding protein|uniref:ABC transporter ATP-binding protein n=1 Tax=Bosea sp. (in: a-proteobacteria) TaxID=1871050 RepID=UPI003F704361